MPKVVDDGYWRSARSASRSRRRGGDLWKTRRPSRRRQACRQSLHRQSPTVARHLAVCCPRRADVAAGLAAFMLLIMFVVGRPEAPARPAPATPGCRRRRPRARLPGPSAGARGADAAAAQQTAPVVDPRAYSEPSAPPPADPSHRRGAAANTRVCCQQRRPE